MYYKYRIYVKNLQSTEPLTNGGHVDARGSDSSIVRLRSEDAVEDSRFSLLADVSCALSSAAITNNKVQCMHSKFGRQKLLLGSIT